METAVKEAVPIEESIEKTIEASEVTKEEILDRRTILGKLQAKVKQLEDTQKQIQEMLNEQVKRIDVCSVRR